MAGFSELHITHEQDMMKPVDQGFSLRRFLLCHLGQNFIFTLYIHIILHPLSPDISTPNQRQTVTTDPCLASYSWKSANSFHPCSIPVRWYYLMPILQVQLREAR